MYFPVPIPVTTNTQSVVYQSYYRYPRYNRYYMYPRQSSVMVGNLPEDFLRLPTLQQPATQEEQDRAAAIHLQNQIMAQGRQPAVGRFEISIVNAVLNKNYGISRMDPYVRLRIGHHIYETHTAANGAKNPYWNKTFQIYNLPQGINSMHIEILDERTLSDDEIIAWTQLTIPELVSQGEVVDDWYKLSGKLGEGLEGVLHLVMSYTTGPPPAAPPVMMLPGYRPNYPQVPIYTLPAHNFAIQSAYPPAAAAGSSPAHQQPVVIQESDIKQLSEMLPGIEDEVIKSVLEASNGNKEAAINSLLQMQ